MSDMNFIKKDLHEEKPGSQEEGSFESASVPQYEMLGIESYADVAERVVEKGPEEYFEGVSVSEAIHNAREFAYIKPGLEVLGQSDLAQQFDSKIQEYVAVYSENEEENYLLGLYLKNILSHENEESSVTIQKISPFVYGRVPADFTEREVGIEVVEVIEIVNTVDTLKEKDQGFKDYIEKELETRARNHIPNLLEKIMYYPGLLEDGTSPQIHLPWRMLDQSDVTRSEKSRVDQQDIQDFIALRGEVMSGLFKESLFADISDQTLPEQFQLFNFLKRSSKDEVKAVGDFIQNFGSTGLEVFVALEQDPKIGKDILYLAETLQPRMIVEVLSKYRDIVRAAEGVGEYLEREAGGESISSEDIKQVHFNILLRARKILSDTTQTVRSSGEGEVDQQELLNDLDKVKYSTVQFVESVKSVKDLNLETLKHISFESQTPQELSGEDREKMQGMYTENYRESPQFQELLLTGYENLLEKDSVTFQVFRDRGVVKGSYALDQAEEGVIDFKAFNIDASYQGARLGEEMMLRGLDQAAQENIIRAQCDGGGFISSAYIERGFVATGVTGTTEDGPKNALEIVRDDKKNEMIETKQLTQDEVKLKALEQGLNMQNDTQKFFVKDQMTEHDYELLTQDESWILTRSVSDRKTGEVYLGYERTAE